jgi:hypothetical protein
MDNAKLPKLGLVAKEWHTHSLYREIIQMVATKSEQA